MDTVGVLSIVICTMNIILSNVAVDILEKLAIKLAAANMLSDLKATSSSVTATTVVLCLKTAVKLQLKNCKG